MANRVAIYTMDPLKTGLHRDRFDKNLQRARMTITITGAVAGAVVTITPNRPGTVPIVLTEGVQWTDGGADTRKSLISLCAAIAKYTAGLLTPNGEIRVPAAGQSEIDVLAASAGSWGDAITVQTTLATMFLNGTAGPTTQNCVSGGGRNEEETFEAFLNGLPGSPVIGTDLVVLPLFTDSSSFLVIWDDT